jgi:hypothetical protein
LFGHYAPLPSIEPRRVIWVELSQSLTSYSCCSSCIPKLPPTPNRRRLRKYKTRSHQPPPFADRPNPPRAPAPGGFALRDAAGSPPLAPAGCRPCCVSPTWVRSAEMRWTMYAAFSIDDIVKLPVLARLAFNCRPSIDEIRAGSVRARRRSTWRSPGISCDAVPSRAGRAARGASPCPFRSVGIRRAAGAVRKSDARRCLRPRAVSVGPIACWG